MTVTITRHTSPTERMTYFFVVSIYGVVRLRSWCVEKRRTEKARTWKETEWWYSLGRNKYPHPEVPDDVKAQALEELRAKIVME